MNDRKRFATAKETLLVVELLLKLKQGELVAWPELSRLIGTDAQQELGRRYVASARRILLNQHNRVCDVIFGVGVKWLTESEVAHVGSIWIRKARRAARRGTKRTVCVRDVSALSREDQIAYLANRAMLAIVDYQASEKRIVETRQDVANNAMPAMPDFARFGKL